MSRCWKDFIRTNYAGIFRVFFTAVFHKSVRFCASDYQCPRRWKMSLLMLEASDTQLHPLHASTSLRLPKKLVREAALSKYWPWREATQLPHCILSCTLRILTFWYQCPCMRLSPQCAQEDKTLVGGSTQREVEGETLGVLHPGSRSFTRVVKPSGDCFFCVVVFSFVQPSKRTPFRGGFEDGRRWRRWGGVE